MKITVDFKTDQMYLELKPDQSVESQEIYPGIVADFNEKNEIVGFDIDNASQTALPRPP